MVTVSAQVISSLLPRDRFLAPPVKNMKKSKYRVGEDHARAYGTHDRPDSVTHGWLVTMDRAVAAGGFPLLKRAVFKTFAGIGKEFSAIRTKDIAATAGPAIGMVLSAILADHDSHGSSFPLHARVDFFHCFLHLEN